MDTLENTSRAARETSTSPLLRTAGTMADAALPRSPTTSPPPVAAPAELEKATRVSGAPAPIASSPARNRSLPLDMLRGLAILLVLGRHYILPPESLDWLRPLGASWTGMGWSGVDLFFVLSGYLVSGLLFSEYRSRQTIDVRRFVIRRAFKIWPPYAIYIVFVAAYLAVKAHGNLASVWSEIWPNVFHVQNYFHTPRIHTWSLAVEEHFYLAVAFAFTWALGRARTSHFLRAVPLVVLTLVAAIAVARFAIYQTKGPEALNLYATHLRFDGLLIGTLLAYWTHFEPGKLRVLARHPVAALLVGALLATPVLIASPEASAAFAGFGLTALYVGFGCILIGWLNLETETTWAPRLFSTRIAAGVGKIGFYSYSVYLWHVDLVQVPLKKMVAAAVPASVPADAIWLVSMALYVAGAYLVGSILGRILEIPALRLRDRLFPSMTPTPRKAV